MSESHRRDKQHHDESEGEDHAPSSTLEAGGDDAPGASKTSEGSGTQEAPGASEPAAWPRPDGDVDAADGGARTAKSGTDDSVAPVGGETEPETGADGETDTEPESGGKTESVDETSSGEDATGTSAQAMAATSGGAGAGGRQTGGGGFGRGRWQLFGAALVVLLLVGAAAGGGGYLYWRVQELEQRVAAVPAERERALERFARSEALARSIDELESRVSGEVKRLEKAIDEVAQSDTQSTQALRERLDNLEEAVATARELAGRDQLDWRLAEVHYLVAVAARRLAIAHDRRAAIAALEAADRSLAEVGDVRLLDLRQRLVDDISALHQAKPADVEGIAVRIESLLQRIPDLPPRKRRERADGGGEADATDGDDWWQRLREGLSSYVVVRRQGKADEPARPRADRSLPAAEKLGYALSEARRAALRREPEPYTQSIQRARSLIGEHFAAESPAVDYFRETLDELSQEGVTASYPDLTSTLDYVEEVSAELKARRERPDMVGSDGED